MAQVGGSRGRVRGRGGWVKGRVRGTGGWVKGSGDGCVASSELLYMQTFTVMSVRPCVCVAGASAPTAVQPAPPGPQLCAAMRPSQRGGGEVGLRAQGLIVGVPLNP